MNATTTTTTNRNNTKTAKNIFSKQQSYNPDNQGRKDIYFYFSYTDIRYVVYIRDVV